MLFVALGFINWLATLLVVESEFFQPVRGFAYQRWKSANRNITVWFWGRVTYFIQCPLCTGVWIAFAMAFWAPAVFGTGVVSFLLTALLIKAIGHVIYVLHKLVEIRTDMYWYEQRRRRPNAQGSAKAREGEGRQYSSNITKQDSTGS